MIPSDSECLLRCFFFCLFVFFRKAGAGSLFRCKSSQISSGAFTHGLLLWRWKYVQIRGHTFSWTLIQQPAAACLIYFSYVPFSKPVSVLVRWKEMLPFEHDERRSEGAFVLIRTLLGGKHVSSLDDLWPSVDRMACMSGVKGWRLVVERVQLWRLLARRVNTEWSELLGSLIIHLGASCFPLCPDSWTAKLLGDQ